MITDKGYNYKRDNASKGQTD